jgi:hypothetical protein
LNIIDKHRLLLTIGTHAYGHSVPPKRQAELRSDWANRSPKTPVPNFQIAPLPGGPAALKAGEVFCTLSGLQTDENMKFFLDIAINEAEVTSVTPLTILLDVLSTEVRTVIQRLVPYLR